MKSGAKSNLLESQIFEMQSRICKAFANPTRLRILDLLGQREWSFAELLETLGISKTNLSQHLAVLKASGVVATRREGKTLYCSLAIPEVKTACKLIRNVLKHQIQDSHKLLG